MTQWEPYNRVGGRLLVKEREATIIAVLPPEELGQVERITVRYDDDQTTETFPVRGVKIGSDWIR